MPPPHIHTKWTKIFGGVPGVLGGGKHFVGAYATRRVLTAYTGNCVLLRRNSDNAEQAFGFTAAGDLDTAAITAWLGGATAYVKTWYDQSGNGRHASNTNTANQPALNLSSIGGKPTLIGDSTDMLTATVAAVVFSGTQATIFEVNNWQAGTLPGGFVKHDPLFWTLLVLATGATSSQRRSIFTGDGAGTRTRSDSALDGYPADTPYIGTFIVDGATSYFYNGGVAKGTGVQTNQMADTAAASVWQIFGVGAVLSEHLIIDGVLSDAGCNQIGNSMKEYYGLSWANFT